MKFTAESKDRHDMWFAVSFLPLEGPVSVERVSDMENDLTGYQLSSRST